MPETIAVLSRKQMRDSLTYHHGARARAVIAQVNVWLARGDGIAIYENAELGHPELGHTQMVSYGSPAAQIETAPPPRQMPDIGGAINWRYQLKGIYRGQELRP